MLLGILKTWSWERRIIFIMFAKKKKSASQKLAENRKTRSEMETVVSSLLERWLSERNLVNREEFDAVRLMAQKALERIDELENKILKLEIKLGKFDPKVKKSSQAKKP